jgi:hypothetical protein
MNTDIAVQKASAIIGILFKAIQLVDPLLAPLVEVIQDALDAAIDIAYINGVKAIGAAGAALAPLLTAGAQRLAFQLDAAPSGPGPIPPDSPAPELAPNDPELSRRLAQAELNWSAALGGRPPLSFGLIVQPLPAGVLAESVATSWDAAGHSLAGLIFVSPDADGKGWYVGSAAEDAGAFQAVPGSTVSYAAPGAAAYGHYDLLTTL